ncbi:MAG: phosphatase PAP2 family protein [Rhodobiaceae bacterium]|nr:phosphatase PAP2 family protein [Rhodobiaceae bacterium]
MLTKLRQKIPDEAFLAVLIDHPNRNRTIALFLCAVVLLMVFVDFPLSRFMIAEPGAFFEALRAAHDVGNSLWFLVTYIAWGCTAYAYSRITTDEKRAAQARKLALIFAFLAGCIIVSGLLVDVLKPIIGRARPYMALEGRGFWAPFTFSGRYYSMPSGHATTMLAAAAGLSILWRKAAKPLHIALYALAIFGAFARIAARKHFASDIFVGGIIGVLSAYWLADLFTRRGWLELGSPQTSKAVETGATDEH